MVMVTTEPQLAAVLELLFIRSKVYYLNYLSVSDVKVLTHWLCMC